MDIQEVKSRQKTVSDMIRRLLNQFEEECGMSVKSVDLVHETTIGAAPKVAYVTVVVELP